MWRGRLCANWGTIASITFSQLPNLSEEQGRLGRRERSDRSRQLSGVVRLYQHFNHFNLAKRLFSPKTFYRVLSRCPNRLGGNG